MVRDGQKFSGSNVAWLGQSAARSYYPDKTRAQCGVCLDVAAHWRSGGSRTLDRQCAERWLDMAATTSITQEA